MKPRNKFIVSPNLATAQAEVCEILYGQSIQAVYDYSGLVKMPYSNCKGCEKETPTLVTIKHDNCAVCGEEKQKQLKY